MSIKPFFRWYDLWIGAYVDQVNRAVYICPLPCIGVKLSWGAPVGELPEADIGWGGVVIGPSRCPVCNANVPTGMNHQHTGHQSVTRWQSTETDKDDTP